MLTPKENLLRTIHWEKAEYVPLSWKAIRYAGGSIMQATDCPAQTGFDLWGCHWTKDDIASMNTPGWIMFEDISDWEKYVKVPDLSDIDFNMMIEKEMAMMPPLDRNELAVGHIDGGGCFTRLVSLMGMENAMISLIDDPEACMNFFEAFTEYKLTYINKMIDALNPDFFVAGDDVASARSLFMSPELYRKLIKPFHKRIGEELAKRGVVYDVHCCGKTEELIDDYIDNGAKMWQSAEPTNDLVGILNKRKITVDGGWDFQGEPGFITDATDNEILRAEVRRCLTEYKMPGYILWPTILSPKGNIRFYGDPRMEIVIDEWEKHKWF